MPFPFRPVIFIILPLALTTATQPAWVMRSNENAQVLLRVMAKFQPEAAASFGVKGVDQEISDGTAGHRERYILAIAEAEGELKKRFAEEKDPLVKQDLQILMDSARNERRGEEIQGKLVLPYMNVPGQVYGGMRALLDDQISADRRPAALVRLRRYAGLEQGYQPLTSLAQQRFREALSKPGLIGPPRVKVEKDLETAQFLITGIGTLLEKYALKDFEAPYAKFKAQVEDYQAFVRKEVLPRSRTDFRLPAELYAYSLEDYGVDIAPEELAKLAHVAFRDLQSQMGELGARIAKQRKLPSADYRDVIRALKKEQFAGEDILPHYKHRLADVEVIIRREHLVTLPERPARIRIGSAAENAQQPAPHMLPPRLLNNAGEVGEFVLPVRVPSANGETEKYDDFTFAAASWTLTAHELRPGHELQFDSMVEHGVSTARALFAFNSTNVEGWGLYSEWITFPYMPLEGQLISLQHRLMRAGRAFLDPELQMGKITREQAFKVIENDIVLSHALANEEVERYTFRAPGQATSYFYGYTRLLQLRKDVEAAMGKQFDQLRYHDFLLAQGLLPPALLRKTVMESFVKKPAATL